MAILSDVELSKMNRKDLLFLIKQYGLRGTGTNEALRERLLAAQMKEKNNLHESEDETEINQSMTRRSSGRVMTPIQPLAPVATKSSSPRVSLANSPMSSPLSQKNSSTKKIIRSPLVVATPSPIIRSPSLKNVEAERSSPLLFASRSPSSATVSTAKFNTEPSHLRSPLSSTTPSSIVKSITVANVTQLRKPAVHLGTSTLLSTACSLVSMPAQSQGAKEPLSVQSTVRHCDKTSMSNPISAPRLTKSALLRAALNTQRVQEIEKRQQTEADRMIALGIKKDEKKAPKPNEARPAKENRDESIKSNENMHPSSSNSLSAISHLKKTTSQKALNYVPHRGPLQPYQSKGVQKKSQV